MEAEVSRLEVSIVNMEAERKHLQQSMPEFAACTSRQAEDINTEIARVREDLATAQREMAASSGRLDTDRRRAELLKVQMLGQLDLEIRQCQARREGIQDVLVVKAPYRGTIAYADAAPATALPMAPVVILAPEHGFRFRLRLTEAEAAALSESGEVTLGLVSAVLHRRFTGRLLSTEKLACEPGHVVAELACMPPPETIRDLVSHDWGAHDWVTMPTVKVRLLWQPPIRVSPLFAPSIGMLAVGLVGVLAAWLRMRGHVSWPAPASPPAGPAPAEIPAGLATVVAGPAGGLDAAEVEGGALGRNLQLLGQRLRESIKRQQIEAPLIRAVEWALDRHHMRAIQHLAVGLDHDPELPGSLQKLLARGDADADVERVARIVRTLAPDVLVTAEGQAPVRRPATRDLESSAR
jgi:hypothetical protein